MSRHTDLVASLMPFMMIVSLHSEAATEAKALEKQCSTLRIEHTRLHITRTRLRAEVLGHRAEQLGHAREPQQLHHSEHAQG